MDRRTFLKTVPAATLVATGARAQVGAPYVIVREVCINDTACVEVCPVDAIERAGGRYFINQYSCIYCGACYPVCPQEAIYLVDRLPPEYMHARQENLNLS